MNVVSRGVRNAFRNQIRTFSIIVILGLSMGLALAMLVAEKAVTLKINTVKSSIGNTITISPAGSRGFSGGGNPLTAAQIATVQKLAHITSVDASLSDRLTTSDTNLQSSISAGSLGQRFANNSGQSFTPPAGSAGRSFGAGSTTFTPPVVIVGTNNPTNLATTQGAGTFKLTSGKVFSSDNTSNVAVIGSMLAAKNNLNVGSTFTAYNATMTVVGIFDAGNTFSNNQVLVPLATEQTLSAQPGTITGAIANVDVLTNVAAATTAIQKALGSAADVTNGAQQAQQVISPLQNIQTISLYSFVGAVGAGAVIILLTMVMIVRERRREIGVIKAIGASNLRIMFQFVTEAVTLTLLGSVIGIGIGVVAGNPITKILVNTSTGAATANVGRGGGFRAFGGVRNNLTAIHGAVGWGIILEGLAAAIVIAIVGSTLASYFIAKVRPAEVMRAE